MKTIRIFVLGALFVFAVIAGLRAEEDLSQKLAQIEAKIKESPDDPMLYYRKAQCLMKLEKYDEGYKTAKKAMELFDKAQSDLAWMLLESVDLGNVRVDVHFNMGPREKSPPEIGIVKPLSFRVWEKGGTKLLGIIDFEIGYLNGKPSTVALGQEVERRARQLRTCEKRRLVSCRPREGPRTDQATIRKNGRKRQKRGRRRLVLGF